jgi:hypothetical protein
MADRRKFIAGGGERRGGADAGGMPVAASELKRRVLTNLYDDRPARLANTHTALDAAVFAASGVPVDLDDEQVLARLPALNLERVLVTRPNHQAATAAPPSWARR